VLTRHTVPCFSVHNWDRVQTSEQLSVQFFVRSVWTLQNHFRHHCLHCAGANKRDSQSFGDL
jgi:hypothetical protein